MAELLAYKCPCCGGKIEFNSTSQQMKCPYCDTEFDLDTLKSYDDVLSQPQSDEMNWDAAAGSEWTDGETDNMGVYTCQSCGGQIVADQSTAASSCPFCDNPIIMTGKFTGDLKPDFVIPFQIDKEGAKAALVKHMSGKPLLPKVFKAEHHIDEIKGVYVPVWLFDADADAHIRFKAEKRRTWSDNKYNYTETSYFAVLRSGSVSFANVPVDGSTKMDDTLMESIEPFDFKGAVDFQTAYLSGYLADRYDVSAEDSIARANARIKQGTEDAFRETVKGYSAVHTESSSVSLQNGEAKYALYPVWILNTSWNGEKYTFAMNGQTGRFVGNLPIDKGAAVRWYLGIAAIATVIAFLVTYFGGIV